MVLKERGLRWSPRVGDRYATRDGFVGVVTAHVETIEAARQHVWLPDWATCREWLRERGLTHPEVVVDAPGDVCLEFRTADAELVRARGVSDLHCIYQIMAEVLEAEP